MDRMKTTRSTWNSSKARPKHASQDYPQSPETSFQNMSSTGGDRCPVTIFIKEFLSRRPPEIRTTGPLYLSRVSNISSQVWYKRQPMGVNKLNDMMKTVIKGTTLEDSWKTFSNHGAGKTVVKKPRRESSRPGRSSMIKVVQQAIETRSHRMTMTKEMKISSDCFQFTLYTFFIIIIISTTTSS